MKESVSGISMRDLVGNDRVKFQLRVPGASSMVTLLHEKQIGQAETMIPARSRERLFREIFIVSSLAAGTVAVQCKTTKTACE